VSAWTILLFLVSLLLLAGGAELLVRGAARLARVLGLSSLVIGLTVVAYGTSAPELAVSAQAALAGQADIALGNVVGSNILNVLFVLGVCAVVAPLSVMRRVVWFDVPVLIGVSILLFVLAFNGSLGRFEGFLLLSGLAAFTVFVVLEGRADPVTAADAETAGKEATRSRAALALDLLLIAAGLVVLVVGARWLVQSAVVIATAFGLDELVIGLTIVAVGTSMPEVATSLVAGLRRQTDIAVGNAIGSSILNILGILGFASLLAPNGVTVAPAALAFDIPVMLATTVACLPIFFTGHRIERWEGFLFLAYYAAYVLYLILASSHHAMLDEFSAVMVVFVFPVTAVTLVVVAARQVRRHRRAAAG
jgi:cation:H+ antiporter